VVGQLGRGRDVATAGRVRKYAAGVVRVWAAARSNPATATKMKTKAAGPVRMKDMAVDEVRRLIATSRYTEEFFWMCDI
jgi:hypothetical protein